MISRIANDGFFHPRDVWAFNLRYGIRTILNKKGAGIEDSRPQYLSFLYRFSYLTVNFSIVAFTLRK